MGSMILTCRILKTVWIALSSTSIQIWLICRCRDPMGIARKIKGGMGRRINSQSGVLHVVLTSHRQLGHHKKQVAMMHSSNGKRSNNIRQWLREWQWQNHHRVRTLLSVTQVQCSKGIQSSTILQRRWQRERLGSQLPIKQDLLVVPQNPS